MKPRILYRFNDRHELEKHHITENCNPQFEKLSSEGELFRCRNIYQSCHDFYGWSSRRAADFEEMRNLARTIGELKVKKELLVAKLAKQSRRMNGTKKD